MGFLVMITIPRLRGATSLILLLCTSICREMRDPSPRWHSAIDPLVVDRQPKLGPCEAEVGDMRLVERTGVTAEELRIQAATLHEIVATMDPATNKRQSVLSMLVALQTGIQDTEAKTLRARRQCKRSRISLHKRKSAWPQEFVLMLQMN